MSPAEFSDDGKPYFSLELFTRFPQRFIVGLSRWEPQVSSRQLISQSIKHQWIKQKTTNAFKLFLYVRQPTHA